MRVGGGGCGAWILLWTAGRGTVLCGKTQHASTLGNPRRWGCVGVGVWGRVGAWACARVGVWLCGGVVVWWCGGGGGGGGVGVRKCGGGGGGGGVGGQTCVV